LRPLNGWVIQCSAVADPTGAACQLLRPQQHDPVGHRSCGKHLGWQQLLRLMLAPCVIHRFLARPPRERQRPGRQGVLNEVGRDSKT